MVGNTGGLQSYLVIPRLSGGKKTVGGPKSKSTEETVVCIATNNSSLDSILLTPNVVAPDT